MQAASGWAPLSHAPRFAPVCICGCQRLCVCMWNGIRRRQGARLQVGTNRRIAASPLSRQSWPGCRAARSPGVVPRGPVTEPPGRCLAIEPLLCRPPGRLCGRPGRLRGRPRPVRGLRVPAVPKRTAARGRPAVRKRVVPSAFIARTGTAVALAREVKADFRLVGCLRSRSGLQLGVRSAFRIFRGTKMGFGCCPCLG